MSDQLKIGLAVVAAVLFFCWWRDLYPEELNLPGFKVILKPRSSPPPAPSPKPTDTPPPKPTIDWSKFFSPTPVTTPSPIPVPAPNPVANFIQPPPITIQYACPQVTGMFWLQYPNTWYSSYYNFALAWDRRGGFYVYNPYVYDYYYQRYGSTIPYPDPFFNTPRNTWVRLPNSPFNICIDDMRGGSVFGQYAP